MEDYQPSLLNHFLRLMYYLGHWPWIRRWRQSPDWTGGTLPPPQPSDSLPGHWLATPPHSLWKKKIHSTVSVSEENKWNHPLETSKHLPGFVKFCFLSLQNVKLLIHQWKYWKFPEYMCCFHGWNLKILLYSEKL